MDDVQNEDNRLAFAVVGDFISQNIRQARDGFFVHIGHALCAAGCENRQVLGDFFCLANRVFGGCQIITRNLYQNVEQIIPGRLGPDDFALHTLARAAWIISCAWRMTSS